MAVLISPMVVPVVIVAVGIYFFFAPLGLTDSLLGLILAHTALGAPFVVITVLGDAVRASTAPVARRRQSRRHAARGLLPRDAAADPARA